MTKQPPQIYTYLLLTTTMFFWAGTFIAGRILGNHLPPSVSAVLRFAIASLVLFFLLRLRGKVSLPPVTHWPILLALALSGIFFYNIFFFQGLQHIEAGRAALFIAATPLIVSCAASFLLKEPLSKQRICGIALAFLGAVLVISNGQPTRILHGEFGVGEFSLMACVISWSVYTLLGRKVVQSIPPLPAVFFSCLLGTVLLFPLAIYDGVSQLFSEITWQEWLALLYLGIGGTALGFYWFYQALESLGAAKTSLFLNLVPLFALLLSHYTLGEKISNSVILGGILVICGLYLNSVKWSKKLCEQ